MQAELPTDPPCRIERKNRIRGRRLPPVSSRAPRLLLPTAWVTPERPPDHLGSTDCRGKAVSKRSHAETPPLRNSQGTHRRPQTTSKATNGSNRPRPREPAGVLPEPCPGAGAYVGCALPGTGASRRGCGLRAPCQPDPVRSPREVSQGIAIRFSRGCGGGRASPRGQGGVWRAGGAAGRGGPTRNPGAHVLEADASRERSQPRRLYVRDSETTGQGSRVCRQVCVSRDRKTARAEGSPRGSPSPLCRPHLADQDTGPGHSRGRTARPSAYSGGHEHYYLNHRRVRDLQPERPWLRLHTTTLKGRSWANHSKLVPSEASVVFSSPPRPCYQECYTRKKVHAPVA
ncbi:uncharacterized protein [Canis lupus baileyi]|uniref:uncharacterized protein n=1 Tax=Canis lupus baileyi TaxID=143281 RepID=UPI003B971A78